jgi:hypothetical protein
MTIWTLQMGYENRFDKNYSTVPGYIATVEPGVDARRRRMLNKEILAYLIRRSTLSETPVIGLGVFTGKKPSNLPMYVTGSSLPEVLSRTLVFTYLQPSFPPCLVVAARLKATHPRSEQHATAFERYEPTARGFLSQNLGIRLQRRRPNK